LKIFKLITVLGIPKRTSTPRGRYQKIIPAHSSVQFRTFCSGKVSTTEKRQGAAFMLQDYGRYSTEFWRTWRIRVKDKLEYFSGSFHRCACSL